MTPSVASPRLTIGTVGPAVIGTADTGTIDGRWVTTPLTYTDCANGSNARSCAVGGPLLPPTLRGVQTWPVLGSRNSGTPGVTGMSRLLRGTCARVGVANDSPARQDTSPIATRRICSPVRRRHLRPAQRYR